MFILFTSITSLLIISIFLYFLYKIYKSEMKKDDIDLIYLDEKKMYILYIYGNYNVSKYEISPIYIKYFRLKEIVETYKNIFNYVFKNDRIIKIEICESEKYNNEKVIKTIYY